MLDWVGATAQQLSIFKYLKMSSILPFQEASCACMFMVLKWSLVNRGVAEQGRQKPVGLGESRALGKYLWLFSDACDYMEVVNHTQ